MTQEYIYTYVRHIDEIDLCRLEMRSFFGFDIDGNALISSERIDPSRSPFMKERMDCWCSAATLEELLTKIQKIDVGEATFRIDCLNTMDLNDTEKIGHSERRKIERTVGLQVVGNPDLEHPDRLLGIVRLQHHWYFGEVIVSKAIWSKHLHKPHMYSTALSTRVARAVANIAVPHPENVRAIDPCCGIGTVLVEALSMGIHIVGRDINPLVCYGTRKNIAFFGLKTDVTIGPIQEIMDTYDVAIIDMPYNLFTHISEEGQIEILQAARRIAKKVVIVTVETIDKMVEDAGFTITDRCIAKKGTFKRQILVCE